MKGRTIKRSAPINQKLTKLLSTACGLGFSCLLLLGLAPPTGAQSPAAASAQQKTFATADEAADALIAAADPFDEAALKEILGPESYDIIHTGEPARDKEVAAQFAAKAREKKNVSADPRNPRRALLLIGEDDWPFAVPIVKQGGKWFFDAKAGRQE